MQINGQVIGMVTMVDLETGQIRLKEDEESFCTLCCGEGTRIHGDEELLTLGRLRPGDYIRSDCVTSEDGRLHVSKIVLLRPAWSVLASPET